MERLASVDQTIHLIMHRLKNIIQVAKLGDELIRKGLQNQNEKFLSHGLEGVSKAVHEMDGFLWDMLSLTDDFSIEPQKVNIPLLLRDLENDWREKAKDLGIKLDFRVEDSFPEVEADSHLLERTLVHTIQNAVEACDKDDSCVQVRVRSKDRDFYEIVVQDNGKGMADEVKAKIFQTFFSTKGKKGKGLGLMIIDRTCKAHKGGVKVESEVGKGTTFTLTFPKAIPPGEN